MLTTNSRSYKIKLESEDFMRKEYMNRWNGELKNNFVTLETYKKTFSQKVWMVLVTFRNFLRKRPK